MTSKILSVAHHALGRSALEPTAFGHLEPARLLAMQAALGFGDDPHAILFPPKALPPTFRAPGWRRLVLSKHPRSSARVTLSNSLRRAFLARLIIPAGRNGGAAVPSLVTCVMEMGIISRYVNSLCASGEGPRRLAELPIDPLVERFRCIPHGLAAYFRLHDAGALTDWPEPKELDARFEQTIYGETRRMPPPPSRPFQPLSDCFLDELCSTALSCSRTWGEKAIEISRRVVRRWPCQCSHVCRAAVCEGNRCVARSSWGHLPRIGSLRAPVTHFNLPKILQQVQTANLLICHATLGCRPAEGLTIRKQRSDALRLAGVGAKGRGPRTWPAGTVLLEVIKRQTRLCGVARALIKRRYGSVPENESIWLNFNNGNEPAGVPLRSVESALRRICPILGISPPKGERVNASRLRKSIAKGIGVSGENAPAVLMDLFGHSRVGRALSYIHASGQVAPALIDAPLEKVPAIERTSPTREDASLAPREADAMFRRLTTALSGAVRLSDSQARSQIEQKIKSLARGHPELAKRWRRTPGISLILRGV